MDGQVCADLAYFILFQTLFLLYNSENFTFIHLWSVNEKEKNNITNMCSHSSTLFPLFHQQIKFFKTTPDCMTLKTRKLTHSKNVAQGCQTSD